MNGSVTIWRNAILLGTAAFYSQPYRGIRTTNSGTTVERKYLEYSAGARELYPLGTGSY